MRHRFLVIPFFVILFLAAAWVRSEELISEIRVTGLSPGRDSSIISLLGLGVGRPLDRSRIREGMQAAAASGQIQWVRISSEESPEGLIVLVEVEMRPCVSTVEIKARNFKWKLKIRRWMTLAPGDPADAEHIELMAGRVQRKIVGLGYPEARLTPFLDYSASDNSLKVELVLELGPPEIVEKITFSGLPPELEEDDFFSKIKTGWRLKKKKLQSLQSRIERQLRIMGYWDAVLLGLEKEGPLQERKLVFKLDPGAHYSIEITAPEGLEKVLEESIPDPAKEDLNPEQLSSLGAKIEEGVRSRGWPLAEVKTSLKTMESEERILRINARPGKEARVKEIIFPGASSLTPKELRKILSVKEGHGSRRHPLTRTLLTRQRMILLDYYHSRGFADTVLGEPQLHAMVSGGKTGTNLSLVFPIEEGIRWTISAFSVKGIPPEALWAFDDDHYRMELTEAWDPDRLERIRVLWEKALADSGYPEGRVRADIRTTDASGVEVTLWAEAGDFIRLGEIVITGLGQTREGIVRRVLNHVGLKEGEPYLQSTILKAQQELYRLGLFRSVTISSIPGQELMLRRGLVVETEEGRQRSYLLGLGWGSEEGARVTLGWSHLNLFGGAHALSLELRYSSRELRYQLNLREPLLPLLNTPGYMAFYQTEEHYSDYDQRREGLWVEIGDRLHAPYRHWLRYEYQVVEPSAPEEILSRLERNQQRIHISSLTPVFEWDYRNDPLNPQQGFLISTALEWAFPAFGSETEFLKLRSGATLYHRMAGGKVSAGLRLGLTMIPGAEPDIPENLQLPLSVRFFAGGTTTHRAFARDDLGIPGRTIDAEGRSLGGNAVVLINLEYQHLLWKSLAGVVFLDGGNVWAEPRDVGLSEFRWGLGVGLRLDTPAGPFRLEYGHKLDRLKGESAGQAAFSFGMAF